MPVAEHDIFTPLFEATKEALLSESLLPRFDGGYVQATQARLGSTQEIRRLFTPAQLTALYEKENELAWLSGDITPNVTPELRRYIRDELDVAEITPDTIVSLLRTKQPFLEAQSDNWLINLYEFFSAQRGQDLRQRLNEVPLIRLEDGQHVRPKVEGEMQAFLPSSEPSDARFPTVRAYICKNKSAREFLKSLGIRKIDHVDEVIRTVLPKYRENNIDISDADYKDDIRFISTAFATDSSSQQKRLIDELNHTPFVRTVDAGDDSKQFSKPDEVYLATNKGKKLFAGVNGVLLLDDAHECLSSQDVHKMLKDCGATPSNNIADMVIKHVLPKYQGSPISVSDANYEADIKRILTAYEEISNERRFDLLNPLRTTEFVKSVDAGNGSKQWCSPGEVYLATEPLRELFAGVEGIYIVDDAYTCLHSESAQKMLEDCGVARHLKRVSIESTYSVKELKDIRRNAGLEKATWRYPIKDWSLRGVEELLELLNQISNVESRDKAALLWRTLIDVVNSNGYSTFQTEYEWSYARESKNVPLDTEIVKQLNKAAWIPDENGELQLPKLVYFETLRDTYGWQENSFLESKIQFKPPIISELARATGIEVEALDLIQKHDLTVDKLREFLGMNGEPTPQQTPMSNSTDDSAEGDRTNNNSISTGFQNQSTGEGSQAQEGVSGQDMVDNDRKKQADSNDEQERSRVVPTSDSPGSGGSFTRDHALSQPKVEVVSNGEGNDVNGSMDRMGDTGETLGDEVYRDVAAQYERESGRNPELGDPHQEGWDLRSIDPDTGTERLIEVKGKGCKWVDDEVVELSQAQVRKAIKRGTSWYLYVVERLDNESYQVLPIPNPITTGDKWMLSGQSWRQTAKEPRCITVANTSQNSPQPQQTAGSS